MCVGGLTLQSLWLHPPPSCFNFMRAANLRGIRHLRLWLYPDISDRYTSESANLGFLEKQLMGIPPKVSNNPPFF